LYEETKMLINDESDIKKQKKSDLKISIEEQLKDPNDEEVRVTLKTLKERPFPIRNLLSPRLVSPRKIFGSVSDLHGLVLAATIIKEKHKLRIAYYCFRSWRITYVAHRYCRMKMASQFFTEWLEYINVHLPDTGKDGNLLKMDRSNLKDLLEDKMKGTQAPKQENNAQGTVEDDVSQKIQDQILEEEKDRNNKEDKRVNGIQDRKEGHTERNITSSRYSQCNTVEICSEFVPSSPMQECGEWKENSYKGMINNIENCENTLMINESKVIEKTEEDSLVPSLGFDKTIAHESNVETNCQPVVKNQRNNDSRKSKNKSKNPNQKSPPKKLSSSSTKCKKSSPTRKKRKTIKKEERTIKDIKNKLQKDKTSKEKKCDLTTHHLEKVSSKSASKEMMTKLLSKVTYYYYCRRLQNSLMDWKEHIIIMKNRKKIEQTLLMKAISYYLYSLCKKNIVQWNSTFRKRRELDILKEEAAHYYLNYLCKRNLIQWNTTFRKRRDLTILKEEAAHYYLNYRSKKNLIQWHTAFRRRRDLTILKEEAAHYHVNYRCKKNLIQWYSTFRKRKDIVILSEKVRRYYLNYLCKQFFYRWHIGFRKRNEIKEKQESFPASKEKSKNFDSSVQPDDLTRERNINRDSKGQLLKGNSNEKAEDNPFGIPTDDLKEQANVENKHKENTPKVNLDNYSKDIISSVANDSATQHNNNEHKRQEIPLNVHFSKQEQYVQSFDVIDQGTEQRIAQGGALKGNILNGMTKDVMHQQTISDFTSTERMLHLASTKLDTNNIQQDREMLNEKINISHHKECSGLDEKVEKSTITSEELEPQIGAITDDLRLEKCIEKAFRRNSANHFITPKRDVNKIGYEHYYDSSIKSHFLAWQIMHRKKAYIQGTVKLGSLAYLQSLLRKGLSKWKMACCKDIQHEKYNIKEKG